MSENIIPETPLEKSIKRGPQGPSLFSETTAKVDKLESKDYLGAARCSFTHI